MSYVDDATVTPRVVGSGGRDRDRQPLVRAETAVPAAGGWAVRFDGREAPQQVGEDDLAHQAGQRHAEAVVQPTAEAEVRVGVTGDVQAVRVGEHRRVPVRRTE